MKTIGENHFICVYMSSKQCILEAKTLRGGEQIPRVAKHDNTDVKRGKTCNTAAKGRKTCNTAAKRGKTCNTDAKRGKTCNTDALLFIPLSKSFSVYIYFLERVNK